MKVKLLKSGKYCLGNGVGEIREFTKGEDVELSDNDAHSLIDNEWAKKFVEKPKAKSRIKAKTDPENSEDEL